MKFSEAWLRQWVDPPVATPELADQLSMAGLEVDALEPVAADFQGVVVGEVQTVEPHPDAEKLRVCTVDAGQDQALTIVCGAPNVASGMRVPTALIGAELPGGFKIKKAKLRGVQSFGMRCSASELGLAESYDGIMPLPADASVGEDFRAYLELDDQAIELDLTPDRGDCLGMAGIAREVAVINRLTVTAPGMSPVAPAVDDRFEVRLDAPQACPRYACRIIRGIDPRAETPMWMRERLRRSGIRSLRPVVDVTNYVLLELGQPMHGFDLASLDSYIQVRMAQPGENITLLGGQQVELQPDTLLIADAKGPLALAGIMGGEGSGVSDTTRDILLESAFFAPRAILGKARAYALHTDSSHRFERGVDPQLQVPAVERATALLLDIVGGKPGPVVERAAEEFLPAPAPIRLRRERIRRILGVEIADREIADILERLEMRVVPVEEGWEVTAPSCRFDIAIEVDLIEEVGRIYGFAEMPSNRGMSRTVMQGAPEAVFDLHRAKQVLVNRGYQEAITYSFVGPEQLRAVDPRHAGVELTNPISAQMSVMRTSLWPGLLEAARYNQARQQERVRIFEAGRRFVKEDEELRQDMMLAGLVTGSVDPEQWAGATRPVDLFDTKADLEAVLGLTGDGSGFGFAPGEHPALHPGQAAVVERGGEPVGWLGMLHPELEKKLGLGAPAFLFEVQVDALSPGRLPAFQVLSRYPSIRRDIAIVVDQDTPFKAVRDCIQAAAPKILRDILLFDVYTGSKVDSGRKSLALGLILQETSHTLTDQQVDSVQTSVLQALSEQLGATLRD